MKSLPEPKFLLFKTRKLTFVRDKHYTPGPKTHLQKFKSKQSFYWEEKVFALNRGAASGAKLSPDGWFQVGPGATEEDAVGVMCLLLGVQGWEDHQLSALHSTSPPPPRTQPGLIKHADRGTRASQVISCIRSW